MTCSLLVSTSSASSPSFFSCPGFWRLTGTRTSLKISAAVSRLCASANSAKPNVCGLLLASVALIQRTSLPAVARMRSMPASPPAPSGMLPTKMVRAISSRLGGMTCVGPSLRSPSRSMPRPRRAGMGAPSLRPPETGLSVARPDWVPRRMTGALKLKLGMLVGACQLGGRARGPPSWGGPWLRATPGGATPGGTAPGGMTPGGAAAAPGGPVSIVSCVHMWVWV
jgi:hypothetical protein